MAITDLEASDLDALVKHVVALRKEMKPGSFLWFRGVNSDAHQLLPKIMRDGKDSDAVFERELRLLTRFRQRSLAYWPSGYPQNDWEQLFAAQHYGIPTRLLDWTENLFVACHFALAPQSNGQDPAGLPVVWAMDPVQWNRSMPSLSEYDETIQVLTTADDHAMAYRTETTRRRLKSPVAIYGTHNSDRIVAQRGTFVVWGADVKPLERVDAGSLWRIRLTGDRHELYMALRFLGFTETMVFPELTSLASELSQAEGWRS